MDQIMLGVPQAAPLELSHAPAEVPSASNTGICFSNVWNSKVAHFQPCFLPVIAAIPAVLSAGILLIQILQFVASCRPRWTRPFVEDHTAPLQAFLRPRTPKWSSFIPLLTIIPLGFGLQLAASITEAHSAVGFLPVIPWLVALVQVLVYRPRTVPYPVLTIIVAQLIATGIVLENGWWPSSAPRILSTLSAVTASIALINLASMPFRDPWLPAKQISKPFAASTSTHRSPEEALNIWQFMTVSWMKPLMDIGNKRQLEKDDVWSLPLEFQHQRLHDNFRQLKGTVIKRLIRANAIDLVIVAFLGLLDQLLQYASPVFLQQILSSMEDPGRPKRVALTYAALSLCARLLAAQVGVFSLWFGRRSYERARGEMITMLYEKTLGRKVSFLPPESEDVNGDHGAQNGRANGEGNEIEAMKSKDTWWSRLRHRLTSPFKRFEKPPASEPAAMGKILNLMRNDVYEVAQRFWEFDNLVKKPIAIILSISLVVSYLGTPALMAVGLVIGAQVANSLVTRIMFHYEKNRRVATDGRLQIISQFVEAIRHLRWYGWQDAWLAKVLSARQKEIKWRLYCSLWSMLISVINQLSLDLTPVVAFAAYTLIARRPLTVDIGFTSMQLLIMMTSQMRDLPSLITALINAWVAVGRIEDFMAEPDRQEMATVVNLGPRLALQSASFAWPGSSNPILKRLNLSFPEGLTVVYGEVGAGKTALLQGLLGEMEMLGGQLLRPSEPIAYCSQTPWLQSMSIRDNILFSSPYDDRWYKTVLDACALTPDLAEFKGGDLSMIGENGIGLSGGQRARVALARAMYSRTNTLLLDDPFAALDQQTAEDVAQKCFLGNLLWRKTVVLVTHRTDLVFRGARKVIKIEDGEATVLDLDNPDPDLIRTSRQTTENVTDETTAEQKAAAVPDKFIEDEHRAYGGIQAQVYWQYLKAGNLWFWTIAILVLLLSRGLALLEQWFIKAWGEAYSSQAKSPGSTSYQTTDIFDGLPPPDINIKPWLWVYLGIALASSLSYLASQGILVVIVYTAARNMFKEIIKKVAYSTFRFYDITPVGRLMNRMTSDIGVIDGGIGVQFRTISWLLIGWITAALVIAFITPAFLVFAAILAVLFVLIFRRFIPTSQNLRRLEMVSLTPLMSNFGELLNGLATVRAFRTQAQFLDRVINVVDTFQKMDHFYWSLQAWLMYRYDVMSSFASFVLFLLAVAVGLSPGLTAVALIAASKIVSNTHGLCQQYGQLQMEFVSVERVIELLHLEQEPQGEVTPPAWWPSLNGNIVFENVTIRYAPHLEPALSGISFKIRAGSKTAILGRTGSGKSTLALALLAIMVPETGYIRVDYMDLAKVDKQLLRTRVTFLAQDPVLFPGTMRQNLDPVDEHTDEDCEAVLGRVCERQEWDLATKIEAGGKNLSQGQRQLVGLARAVLRRSSLIILDEATASIDRQTAHQIQRVLHQDLRGSTVITIAHRLEAVRDADYCIVLGHGKIIEQGPAAAMLERDRPRSANREIP